ncbi:hypothetical protein B0O99DRAFT_647536 [Bisporella sp. PMI_857]|nr:hypothetical protein B0O99DRAFT_647536 [Bisporella sp. PMI_857]
MKAAILKKRQNAPFYPVTGVHTGTWPDGSSVRQEIRDLEKDTTTWTLYILALDLLQYTNQNEMLSWYQIAGIHGRPYQPFNGVLPTKGNENSGYCTHTSILFLTWHRPYLALYEQVLYNLAQQIASWYPAGVIRNKYVLAARNFRIPYWDWAASPPAGQPVLPFSVGGSEVVEVDGPNGRQLIANPLFTYQFEPLDPIQLPNQPFSIWDRTLRYPTNQDSSSATSQNNLIEQILKDPVGSRSFRTRLYNLFSRDHNYTTFSNQAWIPNPNPNGLDSLEALHDQVHGILGFGGHMSYVDYSAFDPIFFLHHAMLDRCFAMWQILNPTSYVMPQRAVQTTYTNSVGQEQTSSTPLTPFYDANGKFWTSDGVRDIQTFGYAYPETIGKSRQRVTAAINRLYSSTSRNQGLARRRMVVSRATLYPTNTYQEWIVNVVVKKHALGVPFFIHVFLGDFNPKPSSWSFEPNHISSHYIFHKSSSGSTSNCTDCEEFLVSATLPLTEALLDKVENKELSSLGPEDVLPFLASNFYTRVAYLNNTEVIRDMVPSLNVSIVSALVREPNNKYELPIWGEIVNHVDISRK